MQKWEYLCVAYVGGGKYALNGAVMPAFFNKLIHDVLNPLGEEGWELICQDSDGNWVFKRKKS